MDFSRTSVKDGEERGYDEIAEDLVTCKMKVLLPTACYFILENIKIKFVPPDWKCCGRRKKYIFKMPTYT